MKKSKKNEAIKEKIWSSLDPKDQRRQEKKFEKSFLELLGKAKAKGALVEEKVTV